VHIKKNLKHENIVTLLDIVHAKSKIYVVLEFIDQSLSSMIGEKKGLEPSLVKTLLHQLMKGVEFMHNSQVIHRDLKPQNILVTKDNILKIADFGLSRMFGLPMGKMTHEIITLWYRPPEILLGIENYTTRVDSWSVGCIMAEMMINKPLFPGDSEIGQLFKIFQIMGTPNESTWTGVSKLPDYKNCFPQWKPKDFGDIVASLGSEGLDLLSKFLEMDPEKRITIEEALSHNFFDEVKAKHNENSNNINN